MEKRKTLRIKNTTDIILATDRIIVNSNIFDVSRTGLSMTVPKNSNVKVGCKYPAIIQDSKIYIVPRWIVSDGGWCITIGCEVFNMNHKWFRFLMKSYYKQINLLNNTVKRYFNASEYPTK